MSEENQSTKNKARNRPTRLALIDVLGQIRHLTIEGFSRTEIMNELNLPERTFDRYMAKIYENDRVLFEEQRKRMLTTEINVFKERIFKDYRYFLSMSENQEIKPDIRLHARRCAVDVSLGLIRLELEAPRIILEEFGKLLCNNCDGGINNNNNNLLHTRLSKRS